MSDQERRNSSVSEILREVHYNKVIELLPVIITMALFGLVGILGNVMTIKFYMSKRRKTPTILLIISLAIVDLIVCVLFVPNIAEMCVNVMYTSHIACKLMHFLGHWFVESSGLILGFIAFDRYRKICRSSNKKITKAVALRAVAIIVIFSCLMSIRDFVNFDIIHVAVSLDKADNSTMTTGHYCTTSDDPELKNSVLIFHAIDAVTFIAVLLVIVVTYSNILWKVCKLKEIGNLENRVRDNPTEFQNLEDDHNQSEQGSASRGPDDADACFSDTTIKRRKRKLQGKRKIRRSEWNVTMLMLAVSLGFFLCVAPYFVVKIGLRSVRRASNLELGLLTQFGLRLVYINSVLNPMIYCLFNPSFRRHVRRLLSCQQRPAESVYNFTSATLDWSTVAPSRNSE